MDDDNLAKSMAQAQVKWADSCMTIAEIFRNTSITCEPPYAKAIIDAARAASSMEETLRLSFEKLGLASLAEISSPVGKVAAHWAAAPLEELQQAGFLNLFETEPQIKAITEGIGAFESRFRLPEIAEATLLAESAHASIAASLAKHALTVPDLKIAVASMQTPWLDAAKAGQSLTAFANLQAIGAAVRSFPPFDENLAQMLRANLGDFRERISWRPEVLGDLKLRSEFYASVGFNAALTEFPLQAFEQSLHIAGLDPVVIPRTVKSSTSEEEVALSRTNMAHDKLQRFERALRRFIDERMTRAFGPGWPRHRLPNGMYEQWQEKKQVADQGGADTRALIEYADFADYELLICRRDNWSQVFAPFFKRPESVRESFQRLYPIRIDTMHARLISSEDQLFLDVEIIRLRKVIPE